MNPHSAPTNHARCRPILVAVDGSEESRHGLRWAAKQARAIGAELRLVTCYEHNYKTGRAEGVSWQRFESTKRQVTERSRQAAHDVLGTAEVDHVVMLGPIESALIDQASDASMIVLGTRSAFAVSNDGYQSTTDRVTGRVPCPVVSIPLDSQE